MSRLAAVICIAMLVLLVPEQSVIAQDAPSPDDVAALNKLAANHEQLAEHVDGLSQDRQLALAPAIAKHPNADVRYIAASIYFRHKKVEEAVETVVDFAV